ncbi:acid protease [Daedalea quercina L-15889]|uniref:Acid protease n=1 Tax=Daedalea quercina L-15889 TaxID=1314783 RepID=A0A165QHQ5_9APHY|nr:acid protease [Daedalea quercina L-15889]
MRVPPATSSRAKKVWKGKERATVVQREGSGGSGGIVLPLQLLTESLYQSVYTLPVLVGGGRQNLSLQVDTGSSDLWIASTSCSTSSCSGASGHLYNPSTSTPTDESFTLDYLRGSVSGPIVWDAVSLGGYNITQQALAAASSVTDEPLDPLYSGILGLALPTDSSIYQELGDDGNSLAANLFAMTSSASAPSAPFISLALERPESDDVPSILGLGLHPSELVPDPSKIEYYDLVTNYNYDQFWAASVRNITVWVDGEAKNIALGNSVSGSTYPVAVLDSGTPVILASPTIASNIHSAIGMSPASDGTYYIPCTTPLNMTITLDDRSEIPLHPLDLSTYSSTAGSYCMSMIQSTQSMSSSSVSLPDLVLGVPFLRSTYMVMAYEPPDSDGVFTSADTYQDAGEQVNPQLGLMALTNITQAMEQFQQSRLGSTSGSSTSGSSPHEKKLSVGIDVLLGCVGFLVLCGVIFGGRWLYYKRKWRHAPEGFDGDSKDELADVRYTLARHHSASDRYSLAESGKSPARRGRPLRDVPSYHTDRASTVTHVGSDSEADALGFLKAQHERDASPARASVASWDSFYASQAKPAYQRPDSPPDFPGSQRARASTGMDDAASPEVLHRRLDSEESLAMPLLAHTRTPSSGSGVAHSEDLADFAVHLRPHSIPTRRPGFERMSSFTLADLENEQSEGGRGHARRVSSPSRERSRVRRSELDRMLPPLPIGDS